MDNSQNTFRRNNVKHDVSPAEIEGLTGNKDENFGDGHGSRWKFWKRRRYMIVTLLFFGEMVKTMLRSNLSVALFPMTENYTKLNENGTEIQVRDFTWDGKTRGFILSVFFYGYLVTNIPGGILAFKYGGCKLFGFGVIFTSLATILTPLGAGIHLYCLIALRVFEGMCEGVIDPCMELLLSVWITREERSSVINIIKSGTIWGHIVGIAASGAIGYQWGWEAIFYCTGAVGVIWYVFWLLLVKEHPTMDKKLSHSELIYIQKSSRSFQMARNKISSIPYLKIMTSLPTWAFIFAHIPSSWGHTSFITQFPAYIKDVLKLEYNKSGYLSALQFTIDMLIVMSISPVIDIISSKNILSSTATRKTFICGTLLTMGITCLVIYRANTITSVMTCLIIITACEGLCHIQVLVNILDLAPKYSSVLTGMAATTNSICGMVAPAVIGYLTENKTAEEWQNVFYIQSGMCLLGTVIFGVFGSGRLQPWAAERNPSILEENAHDTI